MKKLNKIFFLISFNLFTMPLFSGITTLDIGLSYNYFESTDYRGYNGSIPIIGVSIGGSQYLSPRLKIIGGYKNIDPTLPQFYVKEKSYFIGGELGIEYILYVNDINILFFTGISYKQTEVKIRLTLFDELYFGYKGYRKIGLPISTGIIKTFNFFVIGTEIEFDLIKIYSTHYTEIPDDESGYSSYKRTYHGGYIDNTISIFLRIGLYY